ncbi:MAG: GcrA cell cycle regulator [Proteobacteria bacterium]|nr:GcrA cell cycle regulator [Pseudomonadota bacterium]MBW3618454.1 GcrA cell cycle regulator [Pseudomonadota bacterium]
MSWTDDRVEVLKKLWLDGLSASQIAKQLGGVTRNAVIGKVHRLGLSGRAAPSQPARATLRTPRPARPATVSAPRRSEAVQGAGAAPRSEPVRVYVTEAPGTATVLTLSAHMCKWPIGDPSSDGFTFCGRGTEGTYCSEHSRVAYQPPQSKKKSSPSELARSLRRYI